MQIESWQACKMLFRPAIQKQMRLPSLWEESLSVEFPYMIWRQNGSNLGFLLENLTGSMQGWVLQGASRVPGKRRAEMCDLCKFVHKNSSDIDFFTIAVTKTKSIGFYACADLNCRDRASDTGINSMRESLSVSQRQARFDDNILELITRINNSEIE